MAAPMDRLYRMPMTENASTPPDIGEGWSERMAPAFGSPSFAGLKTFLLWERAQYTVFPRGKDIFNAFRLTPFDRVSVVILGQDPYHGPGQAHGLCFSVPPHIPVPPSLENIYKELERDFGKPRPAHGDLTTWAEQGVLLLNATLTVRAHNAGSHQNKGWEEFTDTAIRAVANEREGIVFLLWGRYAQNKEALIDADRHYVLKAPHPSPLSAHRGFIGCGHFSTTNSILVAQGKTPIAWLP